MFGDFSPTPTWNSDPSARPPAPPVPPMFGEQKPKSQRRQSSQPSFAGTPAGPENLGSKTLVGQ